MTRAIDESIMCWSELKLTISVSLWVKLKSFFSPFFHDVYRVPLKLSLTLILFSELFAKGLDLIRVRGEREFKVILSL